ncbi:MAG: flavin reductase [Bacillota bacterium]|nr:flavin reductase [Bacillota bacterium]
MTLHAFNAGCNIIGVRKNETNYGMCCAWAQMLDYDRIGMLLGAQSKTGSILAPGDIVGVSALAAGQKAIADRLGDGHSGKVDKFSTVPHTIESTAILVDGARVKMICEVVDVMRLSTIEADRFVVMKVRRFEQDEKRDFLSAYYD